MWKFAGFAAVLTVVAAGADANQIITLRSGDGVDPPASDPNVTMLVGPANSGFGSAFTVTDFENARTGPSAFVITRHPAWVLPSAVDADAEWISTSATGASEGSTALYAIDFTITDAIIAAATLELDYAVDNVLGDAFNQGVFINGTAISGNSTGGSFGSAFNIFRDDIAALLMTGLNTLYINAADLGGPGGLLFSATITTVAGQPEPQPDRVPEAGSLGLLGAALVALGITRRRRRFS